MAPPHKKNCTVQLFLGKRVTLRNSHLKLERTAMQKLTFQYLQVITDNVLQTQKDIDTGPISYADMMILWQVNKIRNPSEHEEELAVDDNPESDFVMVPYPMYEQEIGKLLGITEEVGQVVILGDPDDAFFDN